jgi:hypothetical protein
MDHGRPTLLLGVAIATCVSGCTVAARHNRPLGVAADVTMLGGAIVATRTQDCEPPPPTYPAGPPACLGAGVHDLTMMLIGGTLLVVGAALGVTALAIEASHLPTGPFEDDAPTVSATDPIVIATRPSLPMTDDPALDQLGAQAMAAAIDGRCADARATLDAIDHAIYRIELRMRTPIAACLR